MKHTPGPWSVMSKHRNGWEISTTTGAWMAHTYQDSRQQANANLIAAAPDLLKLAKDLEKVILSSGHNLCSTATNEERTKFISGILDVWNNHYSILENL